MSGTAEQEHDQARDEARDQEHEEELTREGHLSDLPVSSTARGLLLVVGGVVGFFSAFTLTVDRFELAADPDFVPGCDINPFISCGKVMATEQAAVFGFPNPLIGIAAFAVSILLGVLEPTGLMALAGSSPDPSVVGFTLGGGLSWFSRALGLTAHSVVAFEVVDAEGEPRRVSPASDPDLFWAMCGGGGDFGVVLAVEIMLDHVGPIVGGRMLWPLEMARPVLRAFRQITADAPDELTLWAHLFRFPPMPQLPELIRGRAFVAVDTTFLGSETEANLACARSSPAAAAPARRSAHTRPASFADARLIDARPRGPGRCSSNPSATNAGTLASLQPMSCAAAAWLTHASPSAERSAASSATDAADTHARPSTRASRRPARVHRNTEPSEHPNATAATATDIHPPSRSRPGAPEVAPAQPAPPIAALGVRGNLCVAREPRGAPPGRPEHFGNRPPTGGPTPGPGSVGRHAAAGGRSG